MVGSITEWIEIEKFIIHKLGRRITTPKRKIKGWYKEKGSKELFEEEFMAYQVGSPISAFETYDSYIRYFNYTIQDKNEKPRIPVNAKWLEEEK